MEKKKVLFKVLSIISWLIIIYSSIRFLLGKADTLSTIFLIIFYGCWFLNLIVTLGYKIYLKVLQSKRYKLLNDAYNRLTILYNLRYKLYFSSDKENIEIYSQEIEKHGKAILDVANSSLAINFFSKKQIGQVKNIINRTEELMK